MSTFGEKLRTQRELRGIRIDEIAAATKIGARYLQALEQDNFEELPQNVYAKGYVRAYAQYVGLEPDRCVEEYLYECQQLQTDSETEVVQELSRVLDVQQGTGESRGGWLRILLITTAAVVALALGSWWMLRPDTFTSRALPRAPLAEATAPGTDSPAALEIPKSSTGATLPVNEARMPLPNRAVPAPSSRAEAIPAPVAATPTEPIPEPPPTETISRAAIPESPPAVDTPATEQVESTTVTGREETSAPGLTTLQVTRAGVGTGVVERNLVGESDRFPEGTRIWFWTRVSGGQAGDVIDHVWTREGRVVARIPLDVGGSHWRTQSRKTMWPGSAGRWSVEARDATGRVLNRTEFLCEAP